MSQSLRTLRLRTPILKLSALLLKLLPNLQLRYPLLKCIYKTTGCCNLFLTFPFLGTDKRMHATVTTKLRAGESAGFDTAALPPQLFFKPCGYTKAPSRVETFASNRVEYKCDCVSRNSSSSITFKRIALKTFACASVTIPKSIAAKIN